MRGFFGFIELFLGFILIFSLISGGASLFYLFGDGITGKFSQIYANTENTNQPIVFLSILNMIIMVIGFGVLFLIFGIILIITGILDLKRE